MSAARLRRQTPLPDVGIVADEDGVTDAGLAGAGDAPKGAVDRLIERLTDVPTPAGPTPRQLAQSANFIPLATLGSAPRSESS